VKAPAWFTAEPSGSREQFKGLDDAARHRVRRWLNWQAVVGAVKKNGFRLDDLGLYEPKGLVDATEEHAAWLASEAQRKKAERDRKKKDREDATAAAATVPSEVEVMRERLIEVESELAAAKREIARLKAKNDDREVYREAKEQAIKAALEATLLEQGRALFERAERAEQYTEMWKARAEKAERLADRAYRAEPPTDSETVTEQEFPDVPSGAYDEGRTHRRECGAVRCDPRSSADDSPASAGVSHGALRAPAPRISRDTGLD
jgi:uncharacterized small protein (DUF1192 family)